MKAHEAALDKLCRRRLLGAARGCRFWRKLLRKNCIKQTDAVILLPASCDDDCVQYAVELLYDHLAANHFQKAFFLTQKHSLQVRIDRERAAENIGGVLSLTDKQERDLLDFYNASMRDKRFTVASLDTPKGRILFQYLNSGRVTKRDLFAMTIYNIPPEKDAGGSPSGTLSGKRRTLRKLSQLPYVGLAAYFFFSVCSGKRKYKALRRNYGEDTALIVCPHTGTGDIYNIGLFFDAFLRKNNIEKYTFLYMGGSEQRVGKLFGIQGETVLSKKEMLQISRFAQLVGPDKLGLIQLHHYPISPQAHVHTEYLEGYHGLTFHETFKRVTMGLGADAKETPPRFEEDQDMAERFRDLRLIPGKTVILAPYSASANVIPLEEWEDLAQALVEKGYSVATNCGKIEERPIKGTAELRVEYKYVKAYLEYAGFFIGARSGFCDVVSSANCVMRILTPYETEKVAWLGGMGQTKRFYGLTANYGNAGVKEIEYADTEGKKLIDIIWK